MLHLQLLLAVPVLTDAATIDAGSAWLRERMVEWTIESTKTYADPFNEIEVDVVFSKDGRSWKVPTFWRGGSRWTVRFAPPTSGLYEYRVQSSDSGIGELNGQSGRVAIGRYSGSNSLLQRGPIRVSANGRYFEHTDGTPFYWLGDTWWMGLSDRLSWEGFQKLTADRKAKGFTLVQLVAGLVPPYEEKAPSDPGFCNEGGCVWEKDFKRINPQYFDYADRRIQHLIDQGIVPAIVGGWHDALKQMGPVKMKQHWRYIIARYGAYPVFWITGGEVLDPSPEMASGLSEALRQHIAPEWTGITRYIRDIDPYRHPVSVHEANPPYDFPLQDETLSDFDLFQSGHGGWPSVAAEVAQMNLHYSRTNVVKPIVQGEIGYETLGEQHYADFQRAAFWLSMLNGAAGHTYGANGTWESYTAHKPLHRKRWSFLSWEEGMNLAGSYQVGLAAKLLRKYRWWQFEPHPEWVVPRGTTLLKPHQQISGFDLGEKTPGQDFPAGLWKSAGGDFHKPYAAGISREVRIIYMASFGLRSPVPPTVLGLEQGVRYRAYLWEPTLGIEFDLGAVERPSPGAKIFSDQFTDEGKAAAWLDHGKHSGVREQGMLSARGHTLSVLRAVKEIDAVAAVDVRSDAQAGLVLRYQDADNYVAAIYSPGEKSLYLLDRKKGVDGSTLGKTPIPSIGPSIRLSAEIRGGKVAASVTDQVATFTTPIVEVSNIAAGSIGLLYQEQTAQQFDNFELRRSPILVADKSLERKLYDARGQHRGDLGGQGMEVSGTNVPGWDEFGRDKHILLDAYRPERLPSSGDWILVLEAEANHCGVTRVKGSRPHCQKGARVAIPDSRRAGETVVQP